MNKLHILKSFVGVGATEALPTERQRWEDDSREVLKEMADLLEIYLQTSRVESGTTYWKQAVAAIAKARWLEEHQP